MKKISKSETKANGFVLRRIRILSGEFAGLCGWVLSWEMRRSELQRWSKTKWNRRPTHKSFEVALASGEVIWLRNGEFELDE